MGYAIKEKLTGNIVGWQRWDIPIVDPDTHEVIEAESMEGAKSKHQKAAETRAETIAVIKTQAQEDILAIMSEHQQRNALARTIELQDKKIVGEELSQAELAELELYRDKWNRIRQIREKSNFDEQKL